MNTATVLKWVHNHLLEQGGLEAWDGARVPYPEVAGYIIPSLLKHGDNDTAKILADWLCSTQVMERDGGWRGIDGRKHTFDTASIVEGLMYIGGYKEATYKALEWLYKMRRPDGFLKKHDMDEGTALYLCRASAIIGDRATVTKYLPAPTWNYAWGAVNRAHYIAYALEGMQWMGMDITEALEMSKLARLPNGLMPLWVKSGWLDGGEDDVVATLQFALLFMRAGKADEGARLMQACEPYITPTGGVWQGSKDKRELSWGAKFYLDCTAEML